MEKPPQFTELEQTIKYKYKNVTLVFSLRSSPDDANIVGETHVECFGGVWRSFFQFCIFTPKLPTKLQYNFLIFLSFICFTGRNPHRWVCRLERVDNVYRFDWPYLTEVRTAFRRFTPRGCEISQVVVNVSPNRQFITVEYVVNCGHTHDTST